MAAVLEDKYHENTLPVGKNPQTSFLLLCVSLHDQEMHLSEIVNIIVLEPVLCNFLN